MASMYRVRPHDTHRHRHRARVAHYVQQRFVHGECRLGRVGCGVGGDSYLYGTGGVVGAGFPVQSGADEEFEEVGLYGGLCLLGRYADGAFGEVGVIAAYGWKLVALGEGLM